MGESDRLQTGESSLLRATCPAWLTASLCCAGVAGVANAQESGQGGRELRDRGNLEEVIVTAQRREERLQDVPISITVLGGSELDKSTVEGVGEALSRVPGVTANVNLLGGGTVLTVRGVVASSAVLSGSSPVGYYLDSVPFGLVKSAIAPDSNAYDLARVEILRGPQGTLYGAGGMGGVARVLTQDPNLNDVEFKARTSASSTEHGDASYRGDMAVNLPLREGKLAARAVLGYQSLGGWVDHPFEEDANDGEVENARLKIRAAPTEELSIAASAWLSRADYGVASFSDENLQSGGVLDESIDNDFDLFGLRIGYDFSGVSLVSSTGYLDYKIGSALDLLPLGLPDAPLHTQLSSKVLSQEVNLTSTHAGPWRWTAGAMYRDGEDRFVQHFVFLPAPTDNSDLSKSYAVFGELTRRLADDRLELTAGLRYFEDDVTGRENVSFTGVPGTPPIVVKKTFDATTPRLVAAWHQSDSLTLYTSYSEGFRSGFHQAPDITALLPGFSDVKPDKLKNYEMGAKGTVLDGRLSFDSAIYYLDWQDVQQQLTIRVDNQFPSVGLNGESASGIGVDVGLTANPTDNLTFAVNVSWNDLTQDADVFDGTGQLVFPEGGRLLSSPEYTAGASLSYRFPLGASDLEGVFAVSANYTSEQVNGPGADPLVGDEMLIARATFDVASSDRWRITLFADNLSDERGTPLPNPSYSGWDPRLRPRSIGLQLEYRL